jgi:Glycosyl hydrolase family 57
MVPRAPLAVVLCCRIHEFREPWVHLRAIGEWFDLTQAFESVPQASAVFGISGALLDQLADQSLQLKQCLRTGSVPSQLLLAGLADPGLLADATTRGALVSACREAIGRSPVASFPLLARLDGLARGRGGQARSLLPAAAARDYLLWTHLACMSDALREGDPRVQALLEKQSGFTAEDGRELLAVIADASSALASRWRRLLGNGQIEIAALPYSNAPIAEWLDIAGMEQYPGGDDRARWQVARSVQRLTEVFGVRPRGFIGNSNGLGADLALLLDGFGLAWAAAPRGMKSLNADCVGSRRDGLALCAYAVDSGLGAALLEAEAADRRGAWIDAAQLRCPAPGSEARVLALAWPQRPAKGFAAPGALAGLTATLRVFCSRPDVTLATFAGLEPRGLPAGRRATGERKRAAARPRAATARSRAAISGLRAGREPGRRLIEAKLVFDQVVVEGNLSDDRQCAAERQLAHCESADWRARDSGAAYARELAELYRVLGEAPPEELAAHASPAARAA